MTDDKMLERVRKLLAKAERASTEAEAELFTAKATELMLKYAIDEARLQTSGEKRTEKIVRTTINVEGYVKAKLYMMHAVARGMGLQSLQYTNSRTGGWAKGTGEVYGYESDIESFNVLFASLLMQAATEADRAFLRYKRNGGYEHGRSWKQSFLIGFASEVGRRLTAQRQRVVAETDISAPGTALVVIDRDKLVRAEYERLNPKLGRGSDINNRSRGGYSQGKDSGSRARLGQTSVSGGQRAIDR